MIRIPFQSEVREGVVATLTEFKQDRDIRAQVYGARPRSINPPTWFVDRVRETINFVGHIRQRTVQVDVVMIWGLYDSLEAARQRDDTVDAFTAWVSDRPHLVAANTGLEPRTIEDDPNYVPDWIVPGRDDRLPMYFATTVTLEGFAGG